jgi:hypothetical protein
MQFNAGFECCALGEIDGLRDHRGTPEKKLVSIFRNSREYGSAQWYATKGSITFFTGAATNRNLVPYAQGFADYITKNNLGNVVRHRPTLNRNTKRYVTLYVWFTDAEALTKWWDARKTAGEDEEDRCDCGNPNCTNNQ